MTDNRQLNVKEAARYLGVSKSFLDKLRTNSSTGPVFSKIGRRVVYSVEELDAYLTRQKRVSTSDNRLW